MVDDIIHSEATTADDLFYLTSDVGKEIAKLITTAFGIWKCINIKELIIKF